MECKISLSPFHFRLLLFFLLSSHQAYVAFGDASETRKTGKTSVFSLFNLKEKSRFWSESVLRSDVDDLDTTTGISRTDSLNYTNAGNVANYLMLQEVDSLYLPVPVNFIFIGFEGKGNQAFDLKPEELKRWFTNIDHIFEHTRVPDIGEVHNPFEKINDFKEHARRLPITSHINYNFSVHAIQTGEKVTAIFERAISIIARREDPLDMRDNLWQVDLDLMDAIVDSFVDYFLLENAYNIFILNPKRDKVIAKYGYRRGLSEAEISFLRQNKTLQEKILHSGNNAENFLGLNTIKRPLYEKHPMAKFSWRIAGETDTEEWYNHWTKSLQKLETLIKGKEYSDMIEYKAMQLVYSKNENVKYHFEKELRSGKLDGLHAECLADIWVGKNRWAFIDLTAGPFSWGPAVGGEGVRTELSLPNVEKSIGSVADISEDEAEDRLQEAIQEKFAVFGDNNHQAIDILLAEIDIYELFSFKHCKGRRNKVVLCEELDERMKDLKNELQAFEGEGYDDHHKLKAVEALKKIENWNLFNDVQEKEQNYTVARDSFLAHLGATLWGSMRHLMTPSLADGAFHYHSKIQFQLYFITQEKVKNVKQLPIDLDILKNGLSSCLLTSQTAVFSTNLLSLAEDRALAMAFLVARRTAAVPLLLVNGTYRKTIRSYIDSSILQYQLQRWNDRTVKGSHAHSNSILEIPIFWFFHDQPLLVDKHNLAKTLSDMVIVVQSESSSWESHLQCNGHSLLWNLRWPLKFALAAVSEHLAGLLPIHLVYSQATESPIEDWIWSAGCNPFSATSRGWEVSRFHSDTIARSYVITALEESILLVNGAIRRLLMEHTSKNTFKIFVAYEQELLNRYRNVVRLWKRISVDVGELHFLEVMGLLHTLEDASKRFADHVNATLDHLHPIHCTRHREVHIVLDMTTIPAFIVVIIALYLVLRPRSPKPKIN